MIPADDEPFQDGGTGSLEFLLSVIKEFAEPDHGVTAGATHGPDATWLELNCSLPLHLRQKLKRVFYPFAHMTKRTRRRRVARQEMYAVIFLPGESIFRGNVPLGVPTLGALIDLLIERQRRGRACAVH